MNYYLLALQKYATFSGRATRSEYWYFYLINMLISIVLSVSTVVLDDVANSVSVVSTVYSLAMFIPGLAICARRLHDIGKSGWMILVALIPLA